MLLSLLLTFASLGESEQAQARAHVTNTADKVGCQVWLAKMYAVEFVRRSTGPRGRYRKTYAMIDAMLAKQKPVELVIPKEWAKLEPGTYPYTLDEALTLAKAIRGVPSDQIGDILTKLEAERGKVADLS